MDYKKLLKKELEQEINKTRMILSSVPFDRDNWKPHEKSMGLLDLAKHIASVLFYVQKISDDKVDVLDIQNTEIISLDNLLNYFDNLSQLALNTIENIESENLLKEINIVAGDHILYTLSKQEMLRMLILSHLIHHRGQLSVYLRMLDVLVPGMYGPSADEM